MATRIEFLGVAGYEIVGPSIRVLIDPFLTGNPVAPVKPEAIARPDVILVSHAAADHLGDTAEISKRTTAPIVCGLDSAALLRSQGVPAELIRTTIWGIQVEVGGVHVRPVESHHWSQATLSDGRVVAGTPLGFIVETEPGVRIYHFGDSGLFGDMRLIGRIHQPTVGLLGCTQPKDILGALSPGAGRVLTGEMNPAEAAIAAELLGVRFAMASHYLNPQDVDVRDFLAAVSREDSSGERVAAALYPGQSLVLDGDAHRFEPPFDKEHPDPGSTAA